MADEKNEKAEEKRRKAEEKLQAAAAKKEELERKRAKNRSSVSKKSLVDALAQQNLPTYGNKVFLDKSITLYNIQGGFFNWPSPENVSRLAPPPKCLDWPPPTLKNF